MSDRSGSKSVPRAAEPNASSRETRKRRHRSAISSRRSASIGSMAVHVPGSSRGVSEIRIHAGSPHSIHAAWTRPARASSICADTKEEPPNERSITRQPGTRGRHRRHHCELSAGERAWPWRGGGHQGVHRARQHQSCNQGDGADRRGTQLHRRRRHPRLRHESSPTAAGAARLRCARRQREAGGRRHPWLCARRRVGDRDGVPLSHRTAQREGRPAGSAARHPAGRRRHAAPAAPDRPPSRARHDRHRPACAGARSQEARHHRRGTAGEFRSARKRRCLDDARHGRASAASCARSRGEAG